MKRLFGLVCCLAVVGSLGCGAASEVPVEEELGALSDALTACNNNNANADGDGDGLDDGVEDCLLQRHAPVVYLPFLVDFFLPANAQWFVERSSLRFHHGGSCGDDEILPKGSVNLGNLLTQRHRTKSTWTVFGGCDHENSWVSSSAGPWRTDETFFLQLDSAHHGGSANSNDWVTYGHAFPNNNGGISLEYWFFFPYNDGPGNFNHQGDWESVHVRLRANRSVEGVRFSAHDGWDFVPAPLVTWLDGTHPVSWTAAGTHASYPSEAKCDATKLKDGSRERCRTVEGFRWFTAAGTKGNRPGFQGGGVVNVGERGATLNGQGYFDFVGRWGELGVFDFTSGPPTPPVQNKWNIDRL